jgi:hypothetical protein
MENKFVEPDECSFVIVDSLKVLSLPIIITNIYYWDSRFLFVQ